MGIFLSRVAETVKFVGFQNFHMVFVRSLVHDSITTLLLNTFLIFTKSFFDCHQFLSLHQSVVIMCIVIPKGPIYVFQHKAKCNIQLCCTLSRTLCRISCSKCVNPASAGQNGRLYVSHSPSQSLSESVCTFPILLSSSHRQSVPPTLSHAHIWTPTHLGRSVPSFYVITRNKNQQKLDDKVDTCELFLVGMSYAFLQCKS